MATMDGRKANVGSWNQLRYSPRPVPVARGILRSLAPIDWRGASTMRAVALLLSEALMAAGRRTEADTWLAGYQRTYCTTHRVVVD
jgi:hypothetical protein